MIFIKILKNTSKERKIFTLLNNIISDLISNKILNPTVTEIFIRGLLLHYLIIKTQNKWELPQLAFNYSSDIDFRDFMNLYKKCTAKPYSLLVIDSTLASEISALLSGKINKYEYLTGEEMLPPK